MAMSGIQDSRLYFVLISYLLMLLTVLAPRGSRRAFQSRVEQAWVAQDPSAAVLLIDCRSVLEPPGQRRSVMKSDPGTSGLMAPEKAARCDVPRQHLIACPKTTPILKIEVSSLPW
jgi:hypothetical protein